MVKVSIIVPIHNSAAYLSKCVESLLAQTLKEIEIILVDDASEDNSREIIRSYADRYPKIIVPIYLDVNVRQGGARNRGMEIAQGEYLAFVDSDDFIEPNMCRELYETAQGADMCGADYYIDDGIGLKNVDLTYGDGIEMSEQRKAELISGCGCFWSRIYRKDFLDENHIVFPEGIFYEDAYFNFMTILYGRSLIKIRGGRYYHYYQSADSTTRKRGNSRQYERIEIPSLIMKECQKREIYNQNKNLIDYKYIFMQAGSIKYTCLDQFAEPDFTRLNRIREAVRAECPDYRCCSYYKRISVSLRVYLWLTMHSPKLTVWLYLHNLDYVLEYLEIINKRLTRGKK